MPTVAIFYGIIVWFNYRDHNPPHFHASYQGFEATFLVSTGELLDGWFPPAGRRMIREWATLRRAELAENWESARARGRLSRIAGPDEEEP